MTEIISLWSLRWGKVWTTAKARLTAKPSFTVWLEKLVCSLWGSAVMKSKTNWSSLGCRSAHVCPCCPRTARFFRSAERTVWCAGNASHISVALACFQRQRICHSDPTHNTANLPGVHSSVKPESGSNQNPAYSSGIMIIVPNEECLGYFKARQTFWVKPFNTYSLRKTEIIHIWFTLSWNQWIIAIFA